MASCCPIKGGASCSTLEEFPSAKRESVSDFTRNVDEFFAREFPLKPLRVDVSASKKDGMSTAFSTVFDESGSVCSEVRAVNYQTLPGNTSVMSKTTLNSKAILIQHLDIFNSALRGAKLGMNTVFTGGGLRCATANLAFSHKNVSAIVGVCGPASTKVTADVAFKYRGLVVGGYATLSPLSLSNRKNPLEDLSLSAGFDRPDYKFAVCTNGRFDSFTATYLQNISNYATVAYRATIRTSAFTGESKTVGGGSPIAMEIGIKHWMNANTFLKAKVDQLGNVGLGLSSLLSPGLKMTVGTTIDIRKVRESGHRFGFSFCYDC